MSHTLQGLSRHFISCCREGVHWNGHWQIYEGYLQRKKVTMNILILRVLDLYLVFRFADFWAMTKERDSIAQEGAQSSLCSYCVGSLQYNCLSWLSSTMNNLFKWKGSVSFSSQFPRLRCMVTWPRCYRPMNRQNTMAMYMAKQSCHLLAARIQRERGWISISPSRAHLPWYHFFPLGPEGSIASQWELYWFLFCSYGEAPWPVPTGSRGRSAMEGKT